MAKIDQVIKTLNDVEQTLNKIKDDIVIIRKNQKTTQENHKKIAAVVQQMTLAGIL